MIRKEWVLDHPVDPEEDPTGNEDISTSEDDEGDN